MTALPLIGEPSAALSAGVQPLVLQGLPGLQEHVGQDLGVSGWRTVRQADIDIFGRLTGDEQWIHVDPERAAAGPFGSTVQHGFLPSAWRPDCSGRSASSPVSTWC